MYTEEILLEMVQDEDCGYMTVAERFDEEEITTLINRLIENRIIGEEDFETGEILFDDGDFDCVVDYLKLEGVK